MNLLLECVDLGDKIGHLFVFDNKFDEKYHAKRQFLYNEIFPPIIEKQIISEPKRSTERSTFQLLQQFSYTNKNKPKSYRATKSHIHYASKKFILVYLEDLKFLIQRVGWKVTKLYSCFTFEQSRYKRYFILMNQKIGSKLRILFKEIFINY